MLTMFEIPCLVLEEAFFFLINSVNGSYSFSRFHWGVGELFMFSAPRIALAIYNETESNWVIFAFC